MIDTGQVIIGIVVLLVVVGALVYIFYSRTNAVEKTGYGALIMLSIVSLMIPVFWIMETNGQTQAKIQQHKVAVQQGAALYAKYCFSCHGIVGQGAAAPKLNGNDAVNNLSDSDLLRIISAGIPDANDPSKLLMPAWSEQYGGPLSEPQVQYLFELVRSADPAYLKTNGYPTGTDVNGFSQVPQDLQSTNPTQYQTAVAQATSGAGTGQFGAPVDMTSKKDITINIVTPPPNATCTPACFETMNIKVKVGTKITWVNKSTTPHTVTAIQGTDPSKLNPDPNLFDSGAANLIQTNGTFSYTVTQAAYNADPKNHQVIYFCRIHPGMLAMITIVP
ncbi:MAG TPA: c-type cytochrome, partial [Ktedonobacteraceae bacterium]|nr:c-type cytochrome [Ktedonobacteraceae bacterium]